MEKDLGTSKNILHYQSFNSKEIPKSL